MSASITKEDIRSHLVGFIHLILLIMLSVFLLSQDIRAQEKQPMVRLAKIKVDPAQLNEYQAALKEQMTTAMQEEPGVLTYYAVADKKDPANITIFEMYRDTAAY